MIFLLPEPEPVNSAAHPAILTVGVTGFQIGQWLETSLRLDTQDDLIATLSISFQQEQQNEYLRPLPHSLPGQQSSPNTAPPCARHCESLSTACRRHVNATGSTRRSPLR